MEIIYIKIMYFLTYKCAGFKKIKHRSISQNLSENLLTLFRKPQSDFDVVSRFQFENRLKGRGEKRHKPLVKHRTEEKENPP